MKLDRILLQNFRCFENLTVEFHPRLTVIVAENGGGKTAILDAIALGFGRYLTKLPGVAGLALRATDVSIDQHEIYAPFTILSWEVTTDEKTKIVWAGGRRRDASVPINAIKDKYSPEIAVAAKEGMKQIDAYALSFLMAEFEDDPYILPVIAYYGTNRAILEDVKRRNGRKKSPTRFEALDGALQPNARFRIAFEWFNTLEDQERREKEKRKDFDFRQKDLDIVREAIVRMLPDGFSNPRTEIRPLRFVIDRKFSDGSTRTYRLNQLSDGFRVILGLVMDLARRMAQANPIQCNDIHSISPLDRPAVVLIDEVDLHLHPKWQQTVLKDLMDVFKNTQFIVTTHSPQVLSTIHSDNIRVIGINTRGQIIAEPPLASSYGELSGDVMFRIMGVDPQPPVKEKFDLQRLTELVDQGQYDNLEAKRLMQELKHSLGKQHPQLQRLNKSIQRQEEAPKK